VSHTFLYPCTHTHARTNARTHIPVGRGSSVNKKRVSHEMNLWEWRAVHSTVE